MTDTDWTYDSDRAASELRPMPRSAHTAPQWMRCEWFMGMVRCRLAAGHVGPHTGTSPAARLVGGATAVPDKSPATDPLQPGSETTVLLAGASGVGRSEGTK